MTSIITRRNFNGGVIASAAAAASSALPDLSAGAAASRVDVPWTSDDPHLSGNFLPVQRETDAADLPVIAGKIPRDLSGVYMRNGPNPLFKPLSFTYPMDGDGMIHAVYFDNGRARYRNRFVKTSALAVERRTDRAVYGSLMRPAPVDPKLLHPGDNPGPYRNGCFISVLRHGKHLLAFDEASSCYEMTMDLDTVGPWKAGTEKPIELGAHNKRHPRTGALFGLVYSVTEPTVLFHHIDAAGQLVKTFSVALAAPSMIHDFVLTERYIVLLVGPAVFDVRAVQSGQPMLQWKPTLGTRVGVIAQDGGSTVWLEADPSFVFHFANGFDRGAEIVVDYVQHEKLALGYGAAPSRGPMLHRMRIDPARKSIADDRITDLLVEFPRINDRCEAVPSRFAYLPTLTGSLKLPSYPGATFNTLLKIDIERGAIARHDLGNRIAGEPVFIPRRGTDREDDGYLGVFSFDPVKRTSDFVLLDAARIEAEPVAVVRLPQRVPQGLHGTWIAKG